MTGLHANRVSIVIPVFNKRELTEACLDALRRHAPAGVEIVVVDNGSTDGSAAWLRNLHERGEIRAVLNPENLG
ncbi:MAG: glycosyltransferase, partial [bacterium]|nr:glycosyltransferase [bacterium]